MEEHLAQFRKIREVVGDFVLTGAEKEGLHGVRLKLRSNSGDRFKVELELDPQPPHLIVGLTLTADEQATQ